MLPDGDGPSPVTLSATPGWPRWDLRVPTLLFTAAALLAAGICLATSPAGLAFDDLGARPLAVDAAPEETLVAMKIAAASRRRFDIGIFGNSRSVGLGPDDLGRPGCAIFNFSVAGTSFRSSVALLEILADRHAAPATAVVSLDHFELRMMGPPDHLPMGRLLSIAARDLAAVAPDPVAVSRTAWRQALAVWNKTRRILSSTVFMAGIERWLAVGGAGQVYRSDGSRPAPVSSADGTDHTFVPGVDDHISVDLLIRDLDRLAALRDHDGGPDRVIVYESPLQPVDARRWSEHPSDVARQLRQVTNAACSRLRLECHLGGMPEESRLASVAWQDATHAPPTPLGSIVSDFIGSRQPCESGPP